MGDIGYICNGYLTLVDRSKDIVIHKGYNINSKELEDVIHECMEVRNTAVVGEKSEMYGELPVAVCSGTFKGTEVLELVNGKVSKFKWLWKVY